MGNQPFCSDANLRCSDSCTRLAAPGSLEPTPGDGQQCDPAGTLFVENLEDLNDIDRQLMLFSCGGNLAAVRWLLLLGANKLACDSNGTTCLHVACRSGSVPIVAEFLASAQLDDGAGRELLLSVDMAGWTPLHIAAFMGRREVVSFLLRSNADPARRNVAGTPVADLCSDVPTRLAILGALQKASKISSIDRAEPEKNYTDAAGSLVVEQAAMPGGRLALTREVRFEPFFVPRDAAIPESDVPPSLKVRFANIGKAIFDQQPGRGLAFLLATGAVRDYPMDMVSFLQSARVDPCQVGAFLGEDFSLAKILRMEYINAIGFVNCGLVASLARTFAAFRAPGDLQKVDRILGSLAEVWWRQNQRFRPPGGGGAGSTTSDDEALLPDDALVGGGFSAPVVPLTEFDGVEVRRAVSSQAVVHQLMFSVMMLRWSQQTRLEVDLRAWIGLNNDLAGSGCPSHDLPQALLAPLYHATGKPDHSQVWSSGVPSEVAAAARAPPRAEAASGGGGGPSALSRFASVEGWVRLLGDGIPTLLHTGEPAAAGANVGGACSNSVVVPSQTPASDCMHMSNMLTESTASSRRRHPDRCRASSTSFGSGRHTLPVSGSRAIPCATGTQAALRDVVWMSLCVPLLFLSAGPGDTRTPFAFVNLTGTRLSGIEPGKSMFTLSGGIDTRPTPHDITSRGIGAAPLPLVLLFPDGRWRSFGVQHLVAEVCDKPQLEGWVLHLTELCGSVPLMGHVTV